jgi:hypothetical protein
MKKPVDSDQQWIRPDGKPTQYFLELVQNISKNGLGQPVSVTAPTNNQVMIFNATTGLWVPGTN